MIKRMLAKGNRCLRAALFDEASLYYGRCLRLAPHLPEATFNLGMARLRQGHVEAGVQHVADAVRRAPDFGLRLGFDGAPDAIADWLNEHLAEDASFAEAVRVVEPDEIDEALDDSQRVVFASDLDVVVAEDEARELYQEGVDGLNARRFDEAIDAFLGAIERDPAFAYAYNDLAAAYLMQGHWDAAISWLETATRLDPEYVDAHNNLGVARMNRGDYASAIEAFREAVALRPGLAQTCHDIAVCYGYLGDLDEVVSWNRSAIDAAPDLSGAHHHLGWALMSQGEDDEAVDCFERAIALDPDFVAAYGNLGALYMGQGSYGEAIRYLSQAVERDPDYAYAHANLFVAYMRSGSHEEAQPHFERAVSLNPGLLKAGHYVLLGEACMTLDEYAKAVFWYEKALTLRPGLEEAVEGLEWAKRELRWARLDAQSEQDLQEGAFVVAHIMSLREDGALVSVEGILFMVSADEMGVEPGGDPQAMFQEGQQVEARILTYIPGVGGSVSLKQVRHDLWA